MPARRALPLVVAIGSFVGCASANPPGNAPPGAPPSNGPAPSASPSPTASVPERKPTTPPPTFHPIMNLMVGEVSHQKGTFDGTIASYVLMPGRPSAVPRDTKTALIGHGAALYVGRLPGEPETRTFDVLNPSWQCTAGTRGLVSLSAEPITKARTVPALNGVELEGCQVGGLIATTARVGTATWHMVERSFGDPELGDAEARMRRFASEASPTCALDIDWTSLYRAKALGFKAIVTTKDLQKVPCSCFLFDFPGKTASYCNQGEGDPAAVLDLDGRRFIVLATVLSVTRVLELDGTALVDRLAQPASFAPDG